MVDTSRLLWWPLLRGVILPRARRVWRSCMPLSGWKVARRDGLQPSATAGAGTTFTGDARALGMSYGSPSLESAVDELLESM